MQNNYLDGFYAVVQIVQAIRQKDLNRVGRLLEQLRINLGGNFNTHAAQRIVDFVNNTLSPEEESNAQVQACVTSCTNFINAYMEINSLPFEGFRQAKKINTLDLSKKQNTMANYNKKDKQ